MVRRKWIEMNFSNQVAIVKRALSLPSIDTYVFYCIAPRTWQTSPPTPIRSLDRSLSLLGLIRATPFSHYLTCSRYYLQYQSSGVASAAANNAVCDTVADKTCTIHSWSIITHDISSSSSWRSVGSRGATRARVYCCLRYQTVLSVFEWNLALLPFPSSRLDLANFLLPSPGPSTGLQDQVQLICSFTYCLREKNDLVKVNCPVQKASE